MSDIFVCSPALLNTPYFTHHHHYLCTLPADNAEKWITGRIPLWVTRLATNRKTFFFLANLNPSGFYAFALCLATTFCLSLVFPSLFALLSDLHGRLPVYVRRASSQSAVKAVILLVAIYYPVVCLKKDRTQAKLGAGCWVSTQSYIQNPQLTYILYISALLLMKACVFTFWTVLLLTWLKHSFICLSCFSHHSRICTLTFFLAAEGWNVLVCKIWR